MRSPVRPGPIVIADDPGSAVCAPSAAAQAIGRAHLPLSSSHPATRIKQILRLFAVNNNLKLIGDVPPLKLNQHAWVYASRTNVIDQTAEVPFDSSLVTYRSPGRFLNADYDLVYTNGSSEVFYR
jgi:hypothetical protein